MGSALTWNTTSDGFKASKARARVAIPRSGGDRHTIRVIAEEGFPVDSSYGLGFELQVEDAWFVYRTDARRLS